MATRLERRAPDFDARFERLAAARRAALAEHDETVGEILAAVRERGDEAVAEYSARFDRVALTPRNLRIDADEIARAVAAADADRIAALRRAAERITAHHARQMPEDAWHVDAEGIGLGARWTAIAAVGIYVPGGRAAYPSTVLMNAIPARVAGVGRIAMAVPAPEGALDPLVLAAADIAGVSEVYRVGGAQAIAALAYGTATIAAVDKIVGPGSAHVANAKRRLFGTVGIDMIAGPSELLVVADAANDPAWIAADLMAQAEHDEAAQSILITDRAAFADAVVAHVEALLADLPRAAIAGASWRRHGAVILVDALEQAPPLIDRLAPEHVQLAVAEPRALADSIRHAGALFLGRFAPEAIGDYVAGPSHVLPTARSARFASGLSVLDFVKRTSLIACDEAGLARIGPAAIALAEAEGLHAHALSVAVRAPGGGGQPTGSG